MRDGGTFELFFLVRAAFENPFIRGNQSILFFVFLQIKTDQVSGEPAKGANFNDRIVGRKVLDGIFDAIDITGFKHSGIREP